MINVAFFSLKKLGIIIYWLPKVQKTKEEIAPYIERINTLEEDKKNIQDRQAELDDQAQMQHFKEFNLTTREKELDKRAKTQEQKEKEADERIAFEKEKVQSEKEEVIPDT